MYTNAWESHLPTEAGIRWYFTPIDRGIFLWIIQRIFLDCMYVRLRVCVSMYVCVYVCLCVCVMYICMCLCVYVNIYLYLNVLVNINVCVYVYIYVCIYVCMYICMYVCMLKMNGRGQNSCSKMVFLENAAIKKRH